MRDIGDEVAPGLVGAIERVMSRAVMSVWASPKGLTSMVRKPSGFPGEAIANRYPFLHGSAAWDAVLKEAIRPVSNIPPLISG